jgi:hypothetical protein
MTLPRPPFAVTVPLSRQGSAWGEARKAARRADVRRGALARGASVAHPFACGAVRAVGVKERAMSPFLRLTLPAVALLVLAACDPKQAVDDLGRRTAETVVKPIVDDSMTEPQAAIVTRCVVQNATSDEVRGLIRDVGNPAGTATIAAVRDILVRPATLGCITQAGLPAPQV